MDGDKRTVRRDKLWKRAKVTPMMHHFILGGFDEIQDYNDFMKSAIKREEELTSRRIEAGAKKAVGDVVTYVA